MAENNHQRTLALRAPRGVLFDRHGKVLVENRNSYTISIVREHTKDLERTIGMLADGAGLDAGRGAADRRSPSPRAEPTGRSSSSRTRRWRRWRRSWRGGSTSSCPTSSSRRCRRGSTRPTALAAHLFGYVGEASEAQVAGHRCGARRHRRQARRREGLQRAADGAGRRQARGRQQHRPRDPDARAKAPPVEGRRVQLTIDSDLQKAAEDGLPPRRLQRRRVDPRPAQRRGADPRQPAGLRSRTTSPPASIARTWASLNTDKLRPLTQPRDPGALFARIDVQDRRRHGGARGRASITPDLRINCSGGATFFGRYFRCHLKGGHGSVDMRHAHREVVQRLLLHARQHARRRQDPQVGREARAWSARPASICRTSRRASCRAPSGSEAHRRAVVSRRDDLGGDRPGAGRGDAGWRWR